MDPPPISAEPTPTIPIVDLLCRDDEEIANAVHAACVQHGFFYLVGHDINQRPVLDAARRFFSIPLELKLQLKTNKCGRGYEPPSHVLENFESIPENKVKRKESIMFGREVSPDELEKWGDVQFSSIGYNQWPDESTGDLCDFKAISEKYFSDCWRLSSRLLRIFARSLGKSDEYFSDSFEFPTVMLRMLRYLPEKSRPEDGIFAAGPHTDYGMFTLLATETPGLQLRQGEVWHDIPPIAGAFICNIGDALSIATSCRYKATEHRVILDGLIERYSIAFFFEPSLNTPLKALETSSDDGSYLEHLQKKCLETMA